MPEQPQHFDGGRSVTALVGGTVYVDCDTVRDATVLIDGETIAAVGGDIPANANVIDCAGLTITAGFWNSHVHFFERKWANAASIPAPELAHQLEQMLTRYGFTSVFDIGSMWSNTRIIRDRIESGEVPGPRIRSTGEGLVPIGGNPSDVVLNMMGVMKTTLPEVGDAAAATKKLLAAGVDGIKIFVSSPSGATIPEAEIRAAVDEAHRVNKLVFAHPNTGADVTAAIRAGVDIIAHTTPRSGAWDAMPARGVALTPTLLLWKHFLRHDRTSTQEQMVKTAIAQLRAWIAAGGTILFGTDLGAVDYDPSEEYALMAGAGMSFRQILASLTTAPAERFGASKSGRIAVGCQADIVAFKSDPADVRYTLRDGRVIYQ
ncbi:MAG TPA: amidohydrolase family protein [Thermoanaerobaculia bacterium]